MSAARDQDHRRAGIEAALDRMEFDRRVVDVDDAADPAGHRLAHVVLFGLANSVRLEERRARRVERNHDAARQDRLRRICSRSVAAGRAGTAKGAGSGGGSFCATEDAVARSNITRRAKSDTRPVLIVWVNFH